MIKRGLGLFRQREPKTKGHTSSICQNQPGLLSLDTSTVITSSPHHGAITFRHSERQNVTSINSVVFTAGDFTI